MKTGMKIIVLHEGGPPETCDSFAVVLNKEDELHAYIDKPLAGR